MHPESHHIREAREDSLRAVRAKLKARSAEFVGTVEALYGAAEVSDPQSARPRAAVAGQRLARGMKLAVSSGRALVRLDDGTDLWLAQGATVDLGAWSNLVRSVRLVAGRALALVARETRRPFCLLAPAGEIRVLGTAFEASATADALSVAVLHGRVEVSAGAGRAQAVRGQYVDARPHSKPAVGRLSAESVSPWFGDLALSSTNPRIKPAFSAVAQTFGLPTAGLLERIPMKKLIAVAAVAIIAGGIYAVAGTKETKGITIAPPPAGHADAKPGAPGAKPAGASSWTGPDGKAVQAGEHREMRMKLRGDDGKEYEIVAKDPADLEKKIANLPPEIREKLKDMKTSKVGKDGAMTLKLGGMDPKTEELIQRELGGAMDTYKELLGKGMTPEQAAQVVNQAVNDSIKKQAGPDSPKVTVNFGPAGGMVPGAEPGKTAIMLGVEVESGGEPGGDTAKEVKKQ